MLCVGFVVCIGLYVLAGDFGMGSLQRLSPHPSPPFSGGDLISLLQASSENKTVCACVCVCFSTSPHFCVCVCAPACVYVRARARTRSLGQADLPHLRSAL